jgi:hypothetical protein
LDFNFFIHQLLLCKKITMTNREELIKKYVRRQLSEAEKEAFDQLLTNDDQFAADVQWASKLTAAGDLQLKQSLDAYNRQQRLRWGKYFALTAIALLIVVGIYFRKTINELLFPTNPEPIKTEIQSAILNDDSLHFNQQGVYKIDIKLPKDSSIKSQRDPSVYPLKNEQKVPKNKVFNKDTSHLQVNQSKTEQQLTEDLAYLDTTIAAFREKEKLAGASTDGWRQQLFTTPPQYLAVLTRIRKEIPLTTDEISLNKLHLFGGILNALHPQGNKMEAINWLKAVIDNGDYADYAAEFLIKTYLDLSEIDKAKELLVKFPEVKDKLPVYLKKRL